MIHDLRQRTQGRDVDDFLEEDEQDVIVTTLEGEVTKQVQHSNRLATFIGYLFTGLNVVLTIFNPVAKMNASLLIHSTVSSLCHLYAMLHHAKDTSRNLRQDFYMLAMGIIPCFMLTFLDTNDPSFPIHRAIFVGNLLTTFFSVWLRRDSTETLKALQELHAAKYKYKAL